MTTLNVEPLSLRAEQSRWSTRALACLCIACALVGRLVYLHQPFNGDGAMFAYMGKLIAEGGRFGVDLIDNKFPTVGLVTSLFWRAFGNFWPGYVVAQTALAFLVAAMLTRSAVRAFGEEARWATFLPAVTLLNLNALVMGGFQLETIQTFFACLGACCAIECLLSNDWRDALAGGLCAGCATLIKPTGGSVFLALAIVLVVRRMVRPLLAASVGFAIVVGAAIFWLWQTDQLAYMPQLARQIGEYASSTSFDVWDLYRPASLLLLFGAAMLIRGWVYRRRSVESAAPMNLRIFLILWIFLEFTGILMQRRMYAYHFLPLAGPAAILFGSLPRRTTFGQLVGVLILPLLFGFWGSIDTTADFAAHPANWPAVTQWLVDHTHPGERIWRDETPDVLLNSDLQPASRIQLTFIFMNSNDSATQFANTLCSDLADTQPRYVVLPASVAEHIRVHTQQVVELARIPARRENFAAAWGSIQQFVESRYQPVQQIGDEMIWKKEIPVTPSAELPVR